MPRLHGFEADTSATSLPRGQAWKFNRKYAYTTSEISVFRQLLNGLTWDRIINKVAMGDVDDYLISFRLSSCTSRGGFSFSIYSMTCITTQHQSDKCMRGGSDFGALDITVVVGKPKHGLGASFSFILSRTARLKLAVARLSDEHVSLAWGLQQVEVWELNVVVMLVAELDAVQLLSKKPRISTVRT
ncbi:hypothetical protein JCGZ_26623 [Jatropha curcas]|uniref:Uncharacterized protein n=1 Tax=Jatropha curcas TaxID=180498 RepID=A0A067JWA5_JATCU|nr:hypothetical protein JCGZ_26623 [Jatropha curcas]